ncbi:hypothetical protein OHB26_03675 [Nocardia sp. NBC_01503]|uniref:hypothetical protein n=1 Tax=Nocardia sp. NBC_01503 TaxID=2975997 RepID=UPI002E7BACF4|nr:hypothetical protein [Nocardia sp. NBC_01503]WTL33356.1 hypothetical protein OHB26_03675 [Nocardia sp. NBC_01503]
MAVMRVRLDIEMLDGTEHSDIATTVADHMSYARTRRAQKWDAPQDDMITYLHFLGYAALRRLGLFPGNWDEFVSQAAAVAEAGEAEQVDPTSPVRTSVS